MRGAVSNFRAVCGEPLLAAPGCALQRPAQGTDTPAPTFLLRLSWRPHASPLLERRGVALRAGVALCPDLQCDSGRDTHPLWARRSCSGRSSCGPPFGYSVAGARPVLPAPPQNGASWPGLQHPFGSPDGCGTDRSFRAADTPPAQPGASRGWRGVGAGSPPAGPGPLVSGSENRGLFRLQS